MEKKMTYRVLHESGRSDWKRLRDTKET